MPAMTMIQALRSAMDVMLERDDNVVVFGEDVGYFGGVFRCTEGLQAKYGASRVFDTPINEGGIVERSDKEQRAAERAVQQEILERPAEAEQQREGERQRRQRVDVVQRDEPVGREGAQHHELAVGGVQDAAHPEDERQPDRRRGVHAALQDAVEQRLEELYRDRHGASG